MIVHRDLGPAAVIRPGDPAMAEGTKAGFLNRLNWHRSSPAGDDGLVDSNIDLSHVSAVYALPRALAAMERGAPAR